MPRKRDIVDQPQTEAQERLITVRYTGTGKCFIAAHLFDPEHPETLTLRVPRDTYENQLKPLQCFEIVP